MKKIYRNFIIKEEADILKKLPHNRVRGRLLELDNIIVKKILRQLEKDFKFTVKKESYYQQGKRLEGHLWHKDTGSNNHMTWCEVGVSILLEEARSGGDTYYADNINGDNKAKSDRGLYDMIAHTSDEYHMVEPHVGSRNVFLIFI